MIRINDMFYQVQEFLMPDGLYFNNFSNEMNVVLWYHLNRGFVLYSLWNLNYSFYLKTVSIMKLGR